jgi:hypothetical protein
VLCHSWNQSPAACCSDEDWGPLLIVAASRVGENEVAEAPEDTTALGATLGGLKEDNFFQRAAASLGERLFRAICVTSCSRDAVRSANRCAESCLVSCLLVAKFAGGIGRLAVLASRRWCKLRLLEFIFVLVLLHPGLSISPLEWLSRSRSKPPDVGAMLQQLFTTTVSLCGIVYLSASRHQNVLLMHIECCWSHWEEKHGCPARHTTKYPRGRNALSG